MKNLSVYIKDEFVKRNIDKLFVNCISINTFEDAKNIAESAGWCNDLKNINIVFKNSMIKNHFIDSLSTARPDINVINCNCSVDKFFENDFSGFLVFNNLKRCQHSEIIEEIKNHKGVLLS